MRCSSTCTRAARLCASSSGCDPHSRLNHRGSRVEFCRHEVHRGAVLRIARFERALMGMQPRILGQQRGVDVEDSSLVAGDELAARECA